MCRFISLIFVAVLGLAGLTQAQSNTQTLADIRQELSVLYVEVQRLKRELSTTGGVSLPPVGRSVIDRVDAIEAELQRLTAKTEKLEFRIDRVVRDGTNRIGDLEFRLCELEAECDIAALGRGTTLGGIKPDTGASTPPGSRETGDGIELAIGEQADFQSATEALEDGRYAAAAAQFDAFLYNYPGSPLTTDVRLLRGAAFEGAGENTKAAHAYLEAFSASPNGAKAPEALFLLGRSLGRIGQVDEACVTLAEVGVRFSRSQAAADAHTERQRLACP